MSESETPPPVAEPERRLSYTEKYGASYGAPVGPAVEQPVGGGPSYVPDRAAYSGATHPQATTALVLGIVGVSGLCLLTAPFAWVIGGRAVRDIDYSRGRLGGRGSAQAGRILGIIGTCFLALVLLGVALGLAGAIGAARSTP